MALGNLVEKLADGVRLEGQNVATGHEHLHTIEKLLKIQIPKWYMDFLGEYGYVSCFIPTGDNRGSFISTFDLGAILGYINDYFMDNLDDVKGFLPVGDDVGSFVFFYTELWDPPGVYVSDQLPDAEFREYLAPDIQSLLFDPDSIFRYLHAFES